MVFHVISFLFFCGNLSAQKLAPEAKARFNEAYLRGIDEMREMMSMRGVPFEQALCDSSIRNDYFTILTAILNSSYSFRYQEDPIIDQFQDQSLAFLIYSHHQDTLHRFYLSASNAVYSPIAISADSLITIEKNVRRTLKVDLIPYPRGGVNLPIGPIPKIENALTKTATILGLNHLIPQEDSLVHLVVVPELNIGQIPFAALPFRGKTLIDHMAITMAPHLCNLYYRLYHPPREDSDYYSAEAVVAGNPGISSAMQSMYSPLQGADEESDSMAALFGVQPLKGFQATPAEVFTQARQSRVLYFACHGYYDPQLGIKGSYLLLAPDSAHPEGKMPASEIQHLALQNAQLAILSACQTGVGRITEAGFIGLGRAFYKAGVENTVMSLWSVDDVSTLYLMKAFGKAMQEKPYWPVAQQLREAMLQTKKVYPEALYWSAFVTFGFP